MMQVGDGAIRLSTSIIIGWCLPALKVPSNILRVWLDVGEHHAKKRAGGPSLDTALHFRSLGADPYHS